MNKAIELFGKYIYNQAQINPEKTLKILSSVYDVSGLMCKYFPTKKLLPARQYMQWAAADSTVKSLKNPKNSAIVSLFTPCELLHTMGINTMFPEALACYLSASASEKIFIETAENTTVANTFCSYHKAMIGMAETGVLPKPTCVVNITLACDANQVSFRAVAEKFGVNQFVIDVPRNDTKENLEYLASQLRNLGEFLQKNTGKVLDEKILTDTIEKSKKTIENYKKIIELRSTRYLSDEMTSEMLSVFALHVMLGTDEALKYTEDLIEQLEKQPEKTKGSRILWAHTLPYWQDSVRNLIDFTDRCEIVACDFTFDSLIDTNEDDPYIFMAKRLLYNTFNGGAENRINAIKKYAKKLNADGVIWYCHWGCKQTAGCANLAKSSLEEINIPTLILDGDGCDSRNVNDGQTATRIEAFLELLEKKQ